MGSQFVTRVGFRRPDPVINLLKSSVDGYEIPGPRRWKSNTYKQQEIVFGPKDEEFDLNLSKSVKGLMDDILNKVETIEIFEGPIQDKIEINIKVEVNECPEVNQNQDSFITPTATCNGSRTSTIASTATAGPTKKKLPIDNDFINDLTKVLMSLEDKPSTSTTSALTIKKEPGIKAPETPKHKAKDSKSFEIVTIDIDDDDDDDGKSKIKKRKRKQRESLDISPFCKPRPTPTKLSGKSKKKKQKKMANFDDDEDDDVRQSSQPNETSKHMMIMAKELSHENPSMNILIDGMKMTFEARKYRLQTECCDIGEILHQYPAFKIMDILKLEFDLATKKQLYKLEQEIESEILRNIHQTLKTKNVLVKDSQAKMGQLIEGKDKDTQKKIKLSMGMLCLGVRKCPEFEDSLFRLRLSSISDDDEEVLPITELRPFIDIIDLWKESCKMIVYVEKNEVITVDNLYDAVLMTYCLYWIFNLSYDERLIRLFSYFDYLIGNPQDIYTNTKIKAKHNFKYT